MYVRWFGTTVSRSLAESAMLLVDAGQVPISILAIQSFGQIGSIWAKKWIHSFTKHFFKIEL